MDFEFSKEFEVKVGMQQGAGLSPFLFAVVVDVMEFARDGTLRKRESEFLYADDLVLMIEAIERLRNRFLKWKEVFESKGLKVNLGKTKLMVSSGIIQDSLSKRRVDHGLQLESKKLSQYCVYSVVSGSMVDVPELKVLLQGFQGILHAEFVRGLLERRWSGKRRCVMKWKQYENLHILVTG